MRVTIIPSDKWIRRDDIVVNLPKWNFDDSNIHAIQWYDTEGEIEYEGRPTPPNEIITDASILKPYLDALDLYLKDLENQKIEVEKSDEEILDSILNL
jgi:hypothetical protein